MSEIQGVARFRIHPGKLEEFKRLSKECLAVVRERDTGTLRYEVFFNDDETECVVHEHYLDAQALYEHTEHIGSLMQAILATGSVSGEIWGEADGKLRKSVADQPITIFTPFLSL